MTQKQMKAQAWRASDQNAFDLFWRNIIQNVHAPTVAYRSQPVNGDYVTIVVGTDFDFDIPTGVTKTDLDDQTVDYLRSRLGALQDDIGGQLPQGETALFVGDSGSMPSLGQEQQQTSQTSQRGQRA